MQFKDAHATPLSADIGPFLCARSMAGGWCHYAIKPLRAYGKE